MPSIPLPGSTFTFSVPLVSQASSHVFQASATIAAGDFKRSINNGAFANMDNLPAVTPAAGKLVQIVVSAAETTAAGEGGTIDIVGSDAAGAEWDDISIHIRVGEIAPTEAEIIAAMDADPPAANVTYSAGVALTGRLAEVTDLPAAAPSASSIADAVLDEVVEGTLTLRKIMRITLAKLANKASGGSTTTIRYRSLADDKDRIVETVDTDGNRSAVTLDGD